MTTLQDARGALAAEWTRLNPQTPEEIAEFYRTTKNYQDDLNAWHSDTNRQEWTTIVYGAAKACNAKKVLDIGAGVGHELDALKDFSEVLEAVEPNESMASELEAKGYKVYPSADIVTNVYDMVVCLDVLEHLPDPEGQVLEPLLKILKMGGVFIEATATHDVDTPLHLASLRGWSAGYFLDKYGFVVKEEFYEGRLRIWIRVRENRSDEPNLLLCAYQGLAAETMDCVFGLLDKGWRHTTHRGDALVSRVRSLAASSWYQDDAGDVFLMVDHDIIFTPEDAEKVIKLARETRSIASALYPVRGGTHTASRLLSNNLRIGPDMPPMEIRWAGTGFIAVHRDVCKAIIEQDPEMHVCIMNDKLWFWPMFQPFQWYNDERNYWEYLSEDWAFCERARRLGFKVWLDPSVVLTHIGQAYYNVYNMLGAELE